MLPPRSVIKKARQERPHLDEPSFDGPSDSAASAALPRGLQACRSERRRNRLSEPRLLAFRSVTESGLLDPFIERTTYSHCCGARVAAASGCAAAHLLFAADLPRLSSPGVAPPRAALSSHSRARARIDI